MKQFTPDLLKPVAISGSKSGQLLRRLHQSLSQCALDAKDVYEALQAINKADIDSLEDVAEEAGIDLGKLTSLALAVTDSFTDKKPEPPKKTSE